uniref:Unknow protein n=1 Tax=Oryza sativa subsp. japonica TaxID=39947 RepID=Q84T10_ORYSJ|nr:unknow protein [Oryza sativa Japonica Group]
MSGRDNHQWPPPHRGYDPRDPAAAWQGDASTSAAAAAAAAGVNPYIYVPNPQYAPNPLNLVLNHVLHNPAALAAYHHQQQQQYHHHQQLLHSSAYHQNPTHNLQHRAAVPAPAAPAAAPSIQHRPVAPATAAAAPGQPQPKKKKKQKEPAPQAHPPPPLPPPQQQQQQQPKPQQQPGALERAQAAARKVRDEIIKAGEGVTGWKIAQAVLVALKVDSWGSLGVQLHEVPLLRDLFLVEGKVNTFIHCYVAARKIVSVYDLESEICKNESIGQFEELGLGPFLQHPLVAHYFSVPADLSLVPKLSSDEIINWLQKFMDNSKKKITVENFLDYLAEQKSVSGKENLGARRTEVSAVKVQGNTSGSGDGSCEKDLVKNRKFHLSKQALDERFSAITSRIKKLPGINKHIHFDSTDDETDGDSSSEGDAVDNSESKTGSAAIDNKDVDKRVSSCPYPSKTEEMERLGLKSETSKKPPLDSSKVKESSKKGYTREKRKSEENGSPTSSCKRPKKKQKVQMQKHELSPNCFLSIGKLEKFITTWKEACREHPVQQVLELLANYYAETPKEKKKIIKFFSEYPGIGFLNVAVRAMGCGLLDSLYDAINVFNENKSSSNIPDTTTELMEVEPPPSKRKSKCVAKGDNDTNVGSKDPGCSVTADDVIRRITEFFESNRGVSRTDASQVRKSTFLRTLLDCETCITAKFSANQFSALGHGTFLEFLGKHEQHLPPKLSSFLKVGKLTHSSVEVSVLQQQIEVLLCQAGGNWLEDGEFSEDSFSKLLKRQFPTISFDIVQDKSGEGLLDSIERQRKNIEINNIMFSMSLLEKRWSGIVPGNHDTVDGLMNDIQQSCSVTVSSQEAIKCLLKAPMLSDLLTWSHWDLLFAPSLGSFMHWLLNTGPVQDLACIVTTDGRFIRVDPSATVDQFLEGIIQCSPFQVAVKLLSLLHVYNGSTNTPISLLKCYAQRAIGIIMDNGNDLLNTKSEGKSFSARNIWSDMSKDIDDIVHLVAKFVLDCLGHLPSEFRSLAADVLLAGLRTITKNCYSAILLEATETGQLCMLHDIGLSLGVAEWAEDCRRLCLTDEIHANIEMHASSRHPSTASGVAICENSNLLNATDVDIMKRSKSLPGKDNQIVAVSKNQNVLNIVTAKLDTAEFITNKSPTLGEVNPEEATLVIETIRREEFGLDQSLSCTENSLLKKQHARLGRALHCLSQELYSQDSHLLLELVQNADDNTYVEDVEPTLAFILQDNGIVVLNNESGFSAENIRALCDIGSSTKKGSNQGYIGNKGIGFKSVFRVTDAPEIHSNGFHVKFDITEGQIGFVLPTAVAPYNTDSVSRMLSVEDVKDSSSFWNTCIVLPFRSKFKEGTGMHSIASMFSDLHPSLLLFLHRLKCIKFKNMMNDTLLVMRRKALGNGIVRISNGNDMMSWLVVSKKLQGTIVRNDVCSTEIAVAFTLQETQMGEYEPYLKQQPVFAFLPLRNYGLKFILQGDFVLPSSREEVDADNAWNQWLLSEFPSLFVSAQESFCALPCFQGCPGKAVTTFMSFVPLVGEVHGFFCQLPHLILSKLRLTRCMVLEGSSSRWVYPCNTLRGWDEQTRILISDSLLLEHLGLGYLSKDIIISDTLSRALGIHEYGPKVLIDIISSICRVDGCIESLGLEWLCACTEANVANTMMIEYVSFIMLHLQSPCASYSLPPFELKKWRQFFEEMGVTDFVQVVKVEKNISQADSSLAGRLSQGHHSGTPCIVYDWESPELVLDKFWDAHYSAKARIHADATHSGENIAVESSFMNSIRTFKWIASAMDEDLHYATDLFYNTEDVRSILGSVAPYAVPQVCSRSLGKDIGFKIKVSHSDALMILKSWIASQTSFSASMDQMCKFYTFVSEGFATATIDIKREFLSCSSIFTPLNRARSNDFVPGKFLSPKDLYWHDPTGCSEIITEKVISMKNKISMFPRKMLSSAYPSLCEFFTEACGVPKVPKTSDYVDILLGLSNAALPSEVANQVFHVFARWANDLHSANDNMNDILFLEGSLQKLETTILPTLGDKWVSLHPSFGLVCWVDDNELMQHFEDYNGVNFIQFGELSYEDKQLLYGRIAALLKSLGIPALSKVIYREAIFYGTVDNREKVTVISWLLPYMQRYIYKMHRDTYVNFQQNEITKLSNLQVIVVEKLFHKYKLKERESSCKRRFKCNCLLQGNNLYATQEADSHSLFLELSRLFFDGSPDLHFANFLHMVKTMADSGTTAEQIESFIVNNQNVPDLPEHEAVWSFSSLIIADQDVDCQRTEFQSICDSQKTEIRSTCELNISKHQRTSGVASSWPPNDWKTAPDFITSHNSQFTPNQETNLNNVVPSLDLTKTQCENSEDIVGPVDLEGDWITEDDFGSENTVLAERIGATGDEPHMVMSINSANLPAYLDLETGSSANSVVDIELTEFNDKLANVSEKRDRLCIKAPDRDKLLRIGKQGEAAAHQHFVDHFGSNNVRWVNQENETGLPYDIVVTHKSGFTEYVEVKATTNSYKNWFYITLREWQFALEKGNAFTIARVVLKDSKKANDKSNVLILKNPYKLCLNKSVYLALIIPQQYQTKRRYFEGNSDLQSEVNH